MSKNKKKKSTTQYKSAGFLIPAIALLEAIVLVAVASFAWFYYSSEKTLSSAIVTVNADSGLEIDFKDANDKNFIDLWDQIDEGFMFEPATSVDGRNIFFPTSGNFGEYEDTARMTFREGTANDVNSKYISVDFKLTNTSASPMDVYLSDNSQFILTGDDGSRQNGQALRIAFYNNDGNTGKVDSTFTERHASSNDNTNQSSSSASSDQFTVYFNKGSWNSSSIRAYVYDQEPDNATDYYWYVNGVRSESPYPTYGGSIRINGKDYVGEALKTSEGTSSDAVYLKAFDKADACSKVSNELFYYSFPNPYKSQDVKLTDEDGKVTTITVTSASHRTYSRVIFYDPNNSSNQVPSSGNPGYEIRNNNLYSPTSGSVNEISLVTVYFLKPYDWGTPNCRPSAFNSNNVEKFYNGGSGANMTEVATGIWSYTFPNKATYSGETLTHTHIFFEDSTESARHSNVLNGIENNAMYYFPGSWHAGETSGGGDGKIYKTSYSMSGIYFYNTVGWSSNSIYAHVNAFAGGYDSEHSRYSYESAIQMVELSDNLFYCDVPDVFMNDLMSQRTSDYVNSAGTISIADTDLPDNCELYFSGKPANSNTTQYTGTASTKAKYVYVPKGSAPYTLEGANQSVTGDSYAVLAPGVSAGFQRLANPVESIYATAAEAEASNTAMGTAKNIIPAFASSFDDYIMGSNNPIFTIGANSTVNMSMIIWLEGTDKHCTKENYAGSNINLYLEFATAVTADVDSSAYIYQFIDETLETWTSNQIQKGTLMVDPVIQLYDVTHERGYLMKAASRNDNGKVTVWQCVAPKTLASEESDHVIEFRRVNPYNEEEVWNRWQAGNLREYRNYALSGKVVSFTAFADGSPLYDTYHEMEGFTDIPQYSCGGLWGKHDTSNLYVYDGRRMDDKHIVDGDSTNTRMDKGNLFIHYTYQYSENDSVTIEYKSSYEENFYTFVVPESIYDQQPTVTFPNYVMDNSYAINALEQEDDIIHRRTFSAGQLKGQFYELNCSYDGQTDTSYWGSDVIFIKGKQSDLSVSYSCRGLYNGTSAKHDDCQMEIKYYKRTGNSIDNSTAYTAYLYDDYQHTYSDRYNYTDVNYYDEGTRKSIISFVSVVPCGHEYNGYSVRRFTNDSDHELSREANCYNSLTYPGCGTPGVTWDDNKINYVADNKRIRQLDYDYRVIFTYTENYDYYDAIAECEYSIAGSPAEDYEKQIYGEDYGECDLYIYYIPSNTTSMRFYFSFLDRYSSTTYSSVSDYHIYKINWFNNIEVISASTFNNNYGSSIEGTYNRSFWPDLNTYTKAVTNASWPKYTAKSSAPDLGSGS